MSGRHVEQRAARQPAMLVVAARLAATTALVLTLNFSLTYQRVLG